jgi:hypothetical protein
MLNNLHVSAINPSRVVVLGGGGFIGSAVQSRFEKDGILVESIGRPNFDLFIQDFKIESYFKLIFQLLKSFFDLFFDSTGRFTFDRI